MIYMRNPPDQLNALFKLQDQLYEVGARNFVYLTVPPFDSSPWGTRPNSLAPTNCVGLERDPNGINDRVHDWNYYLPQYVDHWRGQRRDIQIALYDTTHVFEEALIDPAYHGFINATAMCDTGECIWNDDLHPSSMLHRLLAHRVAAWLERL
jgi:phospholipase/lecithinase/hemolysin